MLDDLLGGFGGSGGSKQLSSATAQTTIADPFGGGELDLTQIGPVILAGLVVVAVLVIGSLALRE